MKRNFIIKSAIIILLIIIITDISNAQNIKFGIKGGLNSSGINPLTPYETKWKAGFNVYIFEDFLNFKILSVSGEAGYTHKGFEYPYDAYNENFIFIGREKAKAKLDYMDISILCKLKKSGKIIAPYLIAGPSLGIKVRDVVSAPHSNSYGDLAFLLKNFKKTTFGIKIGVGSELNLIPKVNLVLEARYNVDLSVSYNQPDVTTGVVSWTNNSNNLRNHVFEFMAGVKF